MMQWAVVVSYPARMCYVIGRTIIDRQAQRVVGRAADGASGCLSTRTIEFEYTRRQDAVRTRDRLKAATFIGVRGKTVKVTVYLRKLGKE